jgi:molybdenum cofactor cytidylyltransferase
MQACAAIILAAGSSSRLGTPKQLLIFQGETLLARVVRIALDSKFHPVVVVLGAHAEECAYGISGQPVRLIHNTTWQEGIASSIRAGVTNVEKEAEAIVLLLCDQPGISAAHLHALANTGSPMAASSYAGVNGSPAYFEKRFFFDLVALCGDQGARALLARHADSVAAVPFSEGAADVDTMADLRFLEFFSPDTSTVVKRDEVE